MTVSVIILVVLGLAALDSFNPSVIAVTIFLLVKGGPRNHDAGDEPEQADGGERASASAVITRRHGPTLSVLTYLSAVVGTYFTLGVLLLLGLGAIHGVQDALTSTPAYAVMGVLGVVMFAWSWIDSNKDKKDPDRHLGKKSRMPVTDRLGALFALGLVVSVVEFATAFPFLASIGVMTANSLSWTVWLPLLAMHVVVMVLPEIVLLVVHQILRQRIAGRLERARKWLADNSRKNMQWLIGIVGFLLMQQCAAYFLELSGLSGNGN